MSSMRRIQTTPPDLQSSRSDLYFGLHPREIRLVTLRSGQWSDAIQCQLKHAYLANKPIYKALSYAWGSPRATRPILVSGIRYSVTVNLEAALRRLRQLNEDVILWVDAICINQSDNEEKTQQVRLMHDIYSNTDEVIIYLGEVLNHKSMILHDLVSTSRHVFNYDDTDNEKLEIFRAHCLVKKSSRKEKIDYAFDVFCFLRVLADESTKDHLATFDAHSREFKDSVYHEDLFEELRKIMNCRWWKRIWVIQEVVVPKKITVVYGSSVAPWEILVNAARWLSRNRISTTPFCFSNDNLTVLSYVSRIILDIERMREIWNNGKQTPLLSLLRRFRDRKASDDKDKVYALLGLANSKTSIVPDYSLSVSEVFQNATLDIIKESGSLSILMGDLGRKDRQELPSWVPDWSSAYDDLDRHRVEAMENHQYHASESSKLYIQYRRADEWRGLSFYLKLGRGINIRDSCLEVFNTQVGTTDWQEWLLNGADKSNLSEEECFLAVDDYYTSCRGAVCLEDLGSGIIRLPGISTDIVTRTGDIAYCDETISSVIGSWISLASDSFREGRLGDAFMRTICAGRVSTGSSNQEISTRKIDLEDLDAIDRWFQEAGLIPAREDTGEPKRKLTQTSGDIENAIRSATIRRRFFRTKNGHFGLGPPKTQRGDCVYVLLGGQTPFILRPAGGRSIRRDRNYPMLGHQKVACYEVIGDCYVDGLMNGEAMGDWENRTGEHAELRKHIARWKIIRENWKALSPSLDQRENKLIT
ncbi:hypothetical protein HYFRA_00004241 [Hymenoscyphus fraxineus]|uniref:Heterokaryon incompatibility domain-containing protein n=1 Tax=Hymenoscyphus fraxineus TaxID=746836 RepID=A0A9N9PKH8_9HELO|nr:hypothetical protein HYFRA_00004241 [Hymenoscyphus fraxineus]